MAACCSVRYIPRVYSSLKYASPNMNIDLSDSVNGGNIQGDTRLLQAGKIEVVV